MPVTHFRINFIYFEILSEHLLCYWYKVYEACADLQLLAARVLFVFVSVLLSDI